MTHERMAAWQMSTFGIDNLREGERTVTTPQGNEVLVRVKAVSLNYRDKLVVAGDLLPTPPEMPFVPVSDFVGEVVETGDAVRRVRAGDRVMGNFWTEWLSGPAPRGMIEHGLSLGGPMQGALAEYIVIPEHVAVKAPSSLSDVEAATLPIAGVTAWFALTESGRTADGDIVVVQGTGGVALAAAQLAKALGARVILLSRSAEKLDRVAELSPWQMIDTTRYPRWSERVRELSGGKGADHILELIGGDNLSASIEALAPGGQVSMIGFLAGAEMSLSAVPLMLKRARIQGVSVGHREAFERLVSFVGANDIHPVIDSVFAFSDAKAAFDRLDQGPVGKVVIDIAPA